MDLALHYRIYKDGVNEEVILEHIRYFKSCNLYYLAKNHVWKN